MKHEYSLAHLTAMALPPVDLIEVAAKTGYDYVGLRLSRVTDAEPLYPLITSKTAMAATKARLAATGIKVWDVELARMDPAHDARATFPCSKPPPSWAPTCDLPVARPQPRACPRAFCHAV